MKNLNQFRKNIYSQNGEDGVIDFLCSKLNLSKGWCVEFGAWDGIHLSNTRALITEKEWSAVLIEGDQSRFQSLTKEYRENERVYPLCAFVGSSDNDPNTLNQLLESTPIPEYFNLLSIDVDGNDYFIWKALTKYFPAIVVIEANSSFETNVRFIGEQNSGIGTSAAALVELAKIKGYQLVAHTGNCIFVREDLYPLVGLEDNQLKDLFDSSWLKKRSIIKYVKGLLLLFNNLSKVLLSSFKKFKLVPSSKIKPYIEYNRGTLNTINKWIDDEVYENSIYNYGIPKRVKHLLNSDIGNEITYSDVILFLSQRLKKRISYLELGVSVGKNFYQMINYFKNSLIIGFDIENINPILEKLFLEKALMEEWETIGSSMRKNNSTKNQYVYPKNNNKIQYISGDIWDENSWQRLEGNKFNLMFSDALHSPEALLFEYKMIEKYALLDNDEFLIFWDDLGGEMTESFNKISTNLMDKYPQNKIEKLILPLRGWLGINEYKHEIGIIINSKN